MASDELEHIQNLLDAKLRRLRILEVQQAETGSNTRPEVLTEIDTLRREVEALQVKLDTPSISQEVKKAIGIGGRYDLLEYKIDRNHEEAQRRHDESQRTTRIFIIILALGELVLFASVIGIMLVFIVRVGG